MSFWKTSEGQDLTQNVSGEYDSGGGIEPIPNNTDVLAAIDEIEIDDRDGARYVSARWSVLKPESLQNRKVFQKIWCIDLEPNLAAKDRSKAIKKTDKHKEMLINIDHNAGGKLVASGQEPTDDLLQMYLMNVPMVIKVMKYDLPNDDGSRNIGNWVAAVADKSKPVSDAVATPAPKPQTTGGGGGDMGDEIPF